MFFFPPKLQNLPNELDHRPELSPISVPFVLTHSSREEMTQCLKSKLQLADHMILGMFQYLLQQ